MNEVLAFLFLVVLPWPLWRLAVFETYQQCQTPTPVFVILSSKEFIRGRVGKLLSLLSIYTLIVFSLFWFAPDTSPFTVVLGIVCLAIYLYRSRENYGVKSGLAPGPITILPIQPARDPNFYLNHKEKYGPIYKMGSPPDLRFLSFRPIVCIVDLKLGREFLQLNDPALRLEPIAPFSQQFKSGILRDMSDSDHAKYKKILHSAYAHVDQSYLEELCREVARETLTNMCLSETQPLNTHVDPRPYYDQMMFGILAEIIFGIHRDSEQFDVLLKHAGTLNLTRVRYRTLPAEFYPHFKAMIDFLRDCYHQDQNRENKNEARKSVLELVLERDPDVLQDENIFGNLLNDFWSGRIDTTGLLTWTTKFFLDTPQPIDGDHLIAEGRSIPKYGSDCLVKEVLRLSQSEWLLRRTIKRIEFNGYVIPKGWNVRICVREAHRSSELYDCPHAFKPERFSGLTTTAAEYAPFGLFKHKCVGGHIVQAACGALVEALETDFCMTKVSDGPLIHLWLHWAPSRHFKVKVSRVMEPLDQASDNSLGEAV